MGGGEPGGNMGGYRPGNNTGDRPVRNGPQLAPANMGRFWDEHKTVKTLKLTSDQQRRMDGIFDSNKGALVNAYQSLQREETRLSSMSTQDLQDEGKVFAAIDRVAQARADLEKQQAHILIQIRKELDPEQLSKLDHEIADTTH
jgi:Spy/CpxP family protein refolding chaperone